jgi:hypothetical protein
MMAEQEARHEQYDDLIIELEFAHDKKYQDDKEK